MSALTVPAGIDDASFRALVELLEERMGGIPIERVLVWHLDSALDDVLPHDADFLGINGPEFGSGPPRDYLRRGIQLRRTRGTGDTMEFVLEVIGYPDAELLERTDQSFLYDDTYSYDGTITFGSDAHWAKFFVLVETSEELTLTDVQLLWDVIMKWKPKTRFPILIINGAWIRSTASLDLLLTTEGGELLTTEGGELLMTEG